MKSRRKALKRKMSDKVLLTLKSQREAHHQVVEILVQKLETGLKNEKYDDLELDLSSLEQEETVLKELNEKVLDVTPVEDMSKEVLDRHNVDYKIRKVKISAQKRMSASVKQESSSVSTVVHRPRLPDVSIKPFYGNLEEWPTFWDLYASSIHDREDVTEIDKFAFLRSLLRGDAERTIRGFKTTASNYEAAVAALKRRFGDAETIKNVLIEKLIRIKPAENGSLETLQQIGDEIGSILRSLQGLKLKTDVHGDILLPVLCSKLTEDLLEEWFKREKPDEPQTLTDFTEFLDSQIALKRRARLQIKGAQGFQPNKDRHRKFQGKKPNPREVGLPSRKRNTDEDYETTASALSAQTGSKEHEGVKYPCIFCGKDHPSFKCNEVEKMSMSDRKQCVRSKRACWNCLRVGHSIKGCHVRIKCQVCKGKHNTLLHYGKDDTGNESEDTENKSPENGTSFSGTAVANEEVLLMTVKAELHAKDGNIVPVRCLFDNGSQRSFISTRVARKVGCQGVEDANVQIVGIGGNLAVNREPLKVGTITLGPCKKEPIGEIQAIIIEKLCGSMRKIPKGPWLSELKRKGIRLTDDVEQFEGDSGEIDLLIGSDTYWQYVQSRTYRTKEGPVAVKTRLGWTLNGPVNKTLKTPSLINSMFIKVQNEEYIDSMLKAFWEIESIGIKDSEVGNEELSRMKCEKERFSSTIIQRSDLHYEVVLPKVHERLPEYNKANAMGRLNQLTRKLEKNPEDMEKYHEGVTSMLENGFAEEVPESESGTTNVFFIPHRAVIKEDRETTKLRIVFDGSARDAKGTSLNECLDSGPNLNPEIVHLLLKFRTHKIVLTSDVEKAFLQIWIEKSDRDLCRFLWFTDPNSPNREIKEYRMTRVLFGLNCSPYLLAATLQYHCSKYLLEYPDTARSLLSEMYVDDWISGADSVEKAYQKYQEGSKILSEGGFTLRKWKTNSSELLQRINGEESTNTGEVSLLGENTPKILGLKWCSRRDVFVYGLKEFVDTVSVAKSLTKREMLSISSRIFDPLGLISPIVIETKILLQQLWVLGIGWDAEVPTSIQLRWRKWLQELEQASEIVFPRPFDIQDNSIVQLHIFTDASNVAYDASAYLKVENPEGVEVRLVMSKTRVAPLKPMMIHRKELMAMVLGVRLCDYIKEALSIKDVDTYYWSDSHVSLYWVKSDPKRWKPFVANRVTEIQDRTKPNMSHWGYCPGKENPADIPSRGISATALKTDALWMSGPTWLKQDKESWPKFPKDNAKTVQVEREQRKQISLVTQTVKELFEPEKSSKYLKTIRVTAWIFRFVRNFKLKKRSYPGTIREPLQLEEIKSAETYWWKTVQRTLYPKEVFVLSRKEKLTKSEILELDPFMSEDGLIRIKGRIQESELHTEHKHPVIVNEHHWLIPLYIEYCHRLINHAGVNDTLIKTREVCWITKGRQVVKKYLRRCVICRRLQGSAFNQTTAPLPRDRVAEGPPFQVIGVDFFGPILLKPSRTHQPQVLTSQGLYKSYGLIITCAKTRAVHLELLTSMETTAFLRAFQRFVGRRGLPSVVYSDNAKTFKSSCKILESANHTLFTDDSLQDYSSSNGIKWKFIVERAPWWGGMWERLVRSVKDVAKKMLQRARLNFEEMLTVLVQIEGIINSRPLTYTYSDSKEPCPISPSDLLIGRRVTSLPQELPEGDQFWTEEVDASRRMKYQEKLSQEFWSRWKNEYLTDLKKTNLKFRETRIPKVGDVCIVSDDGLKRCLWPMGIITKLYRGRDDKIRSVQLRIRGKLLNRPVQRLVPLLPDDSEAIPEESPNLNENPVVDEHVTPQNSDESTNVEVHESSVGNAKEPNEIVEHVPITETESEAQTRPVQEDKCELPDRPIGGECKKTRSGRPTKLPTRFKDYYL